MINASVKAIRRDKTLIFIPGYNVNKTILKVVNKLLQLRKELTFSILYVDNNSNDGSFELVKKLVKRKHIRNIKLIKNPKNLGYGGSQKVAFNYAFKNGFDYFIEYDSDMQYPLDRIIDLYKRIKETNASVVFGSRVTNKRDSKEMPKWKLFGNKFFDRLINWAFNINVSEIHTGFRIYNLKIIKGFNLDKCHNDYRWTLDSVIEISRINKNFSEIPVKALYHKDIHSPDVKQLFKTMFYMLYKSLIYKIIKR